MPQEDPSRTESATPKRRNKARDQGSVAKSQEVSKLATIFAGYVALYFYAAYIWEDLQKVFRWYFGGFNDFELTAANIQQIIMQVGFDLAVMTLPVMLFIGLIAYVSLRWQVGKLWTFQHMTKFNLGKHFNIMAGMKRLFLDVQTLIRLGKSILQSLIIGIAAWWVLEDEMGNLLPLYYQEVDFLAAYMIETGGRMALYTFLPMAVIAGFDLWYQRYEYEENLKMTKDEVKDERKQAEGDPIIKNQQKQKMMEFMAMRMMESVPKADVVITNPTHYAVALQYDTSVAPAPMVVAKGTDRLALRIREVAQEHGVPIRENKPLAQALYKTVEIGDIIPEEMYQAVATILAQVFKHKKQ